MSHCVFFHNWIIFLHVWWFDPACQQGFRRRLLAVTSYFNTCLFVALRGVIVSMLLLFSRLRCHFTVYTEVWNMLVFPHLGLPLCCDSLWGKICCLFGGKKKDVLCSCISSGCQVEGDGNEEVLSCVGGRSFRSVRERWWYIALSKCGVSADLWPRLPLLPLSPVYCQAVTHKQANHPLFTACLFSSFFFLIQGNKTFLFVFLHVWDCQISLKVFRYFHHIWVMKTTHPEELLTKSGCLRETFCAALQQKFKSAWG